VRATRFLGLALSVVCAAGVLAGCGDRGTKDGGGSKGGEGSKGGNAPQADRQVLDDLKVIGLAYHSFNDVKKRGPKDADELKPFLGENQSAYQGLKDGRYVFQWNVRMMDVMKGTGTSNTVLAYERDVPTRGGAVLTVDGSPQTMTAEEFKKAPLAKPKGP
jgi:hypothetical protein